MRTLIWIACFICIVSCQSVKYVPVESVRTDSVYVNRVHRDSVHLRDSIFVMVKGDTVWMEKYKYLYKDRVLRDTVRVVERDTVREPYSVEKELTRWQQWKIELGGFAMKAIAIMLAFGIFRFVRRLKK